MCICVCVCVCVCVCMYVCMYVCVCAQLNYTVTLCMNFLLCNRHWNKFLGSQAYCIIVP